MQIFSHCCCFLIIRYWMDWSPRRRLKSFVDHLTPDYPFNTIDKCKFSSNLYWTYLHYWMQIMIYHPSHSQQYYSSTEIITQTYWNSSIKPSNYHNQKAYYMFQVFGIYNIVGTKGVRGKIFSSSKIPFSPACPRFKRPVRVVFRRKNTN